MNLLKEIISKNISGMGPADIQEASAAASIESKIWEEFMGNDSKNSETIIKSVASTNPDIIVFVSLFKNAFFRILAEMNVKLANEIKSLEKKFELVCEAALKQETK